MSEGTTAREERLARAIAAAGRVARDEDGFTVYAMGSHPDAFRVWEDPHAGTRCTCAGFAEAFSTGGEAGCEHVLAVALHLDPPDEEVAPAGAEVTFAALRRVV